MSFNEYMKGTQAPPTQLRRILPFIFIIFLIFGLAHYFIFAVTTRSFSDFSLEILYALVLLVGLCAMPLGFLATRAKKGKLGFLTWYGYVWMGFFTILFFFTLVESTIIVFYHHPYSYWVIVASFICGLWALYKGTKKPSLVTHQLKNEKLKGLKLIQVSDLHVGMLHLNQKWLAKVVACINQANPEIVVITGDLVEGEYRKIVPKLFALKNISAQKKYYITGNHEYIHGSGSWEDALQDLGFHILHNQNDVISYKDSKILMAGIPDRTVGRFIKNKDSLPDAALKSNVTTDYKILLAHQPSSVFDIHTEKCDLILSGHTHGGQIFPFHLLVRLAQPVVSGFKYVNNILVFAHQGTGLWGPPMRWFSRSEIVLLEWI